jgi:hypothetical protein
MASLLALSNAELEEAKRRFRYRNWANVGTLIAGLAALFVPPTITYLFAFIALVSQAVAWWCRYRGTQMQGIAEEARRRALLIGALGAVHEPVDTVDIRQKLSKRAEDRADEFENPNYYTTMEPTGPVRFRDSLQESAFWSKHLYAAAANRAFAISAVLFITVLLIAFLVLPLASGSVQLLVARTLVVALGFITAYDEFGRGLAWRTAAVQAEAVDRRLERLDINSVEPALGVFGDYSVATATAPPIPTALYKKRQNRLNKGWEDRKKEVQGK